MNNDTISRQAAIDLWEKYHPTIAVDAMKYDAELRQLPPARPTEASCWGCNCQKMERLKEQKTFSEMVHLHDAERREDG